MRVSRVAVAISISIPLACTNGSSGPSQPAASTLQLTTSGGTITSGDLSIAFPAGAVKGPVAVTVTPVAASSGQLAAWTLEPAGMPLAAAATIRHPGPFPQRAGLFWTSGGETWLFPSAREGDGLRASVRTLGYDATGGSTAALRSGRPAPSASSAGGGGLAIAIVDCQAELSLVTSRIGLANWETNLALVSRLEQEYSALVTQCTGLLVQAIQDRVCQALDSATLFAQATVANTYPDFATVVKRLLSSSAMVDATGAACSTAGVDALLTAKFAQFMAFLSADLVHPQFADVLVTRALRDLFTYDASCREIGLGAVCDRFGSELYPQALDLARQGAYAECLATGSALELSQLYALGTAVGASGPFYGFATYSYADLESDVNYCQPSRLVVRVFDSFPTEVTSARQEIAGAGAMGAAVTGASVQMPEGGSITIGGNVLVPVCPDATPVATDSLVAKIAGVEIARRPASGTLWTISTAPFDVLPSRDLPSAGLPASTTSFTVELQRQGPGCGIFPSASPLYRINVNQGPPAASTRLSAGTDATCGVTSAGGVRCWGDNFLGDLGIGSTDNALVQPTPADVPGLSGVSSLDQQAPVSHCAVLSGGGLKCWGANANGQLGDGTTVNRLTPVDVVGLSGSAMGVAASGSARCAVVGPGDVQCWGQSQMFLAGSTGGSATSMVPISVTGVTEAAAVVVGAGHGCAVTIGGAAKCWGRNSVGELGSGATGVSTGTNASDVVGLSAGVTGIAAGSDHTCALLASGGVKCWGLNSFGQLGDGSTTDRSAPVDVVGLPGPATAIAAAPSWQTTCALASGRVFCWGQPGGGFLPGTSNVIPHPTPTEVVAIADAVAITMGPFHACALRSSGTAMCWGIESSGRLGNGVVGSGAIVGPVPVLNYP